MEKSDKDTSRVDVFLSYEHSLKSVVDRICSELENEGIRCWYAPRDVIGDYATSIVNAIDSASVFVVLLNNESSKSPHVLNEVEMAYKRIIDNQGELTILPFKLDDKDLSKAMEYYVKRMHWIDASLQGIENAVQELKNKIKAIIRPVNEEIKKSCERHSNTYYDSTDKKETERLKKQRILLEKFDKFLYDEVASQTEDMRVLDVGSNNGEFIMNRLGNKSNLTALLGLEYSQGTVNIANESFGNDKIFFEQCDLESDDFEDKLSDICKRRGISDFNVVNISMVLLHIKNPIKMLRTIRKFTKPDAVVIVKDIDDGLNIAYPDKDGMFETAIGLCAQDPLSGYRKSGRQIYGLLRKSGFRKIELLKDGINTVGMDYDDRLALFEIYFSFVKQDFADFARRNPKDKTVVHNAEWLENNYPKMEEEFIEEDFFFNLGFMLFKARR